MPQYKTIQIKVAPNVVAGEERLRCAMCGEALEYADKRLAWEWLVGHAKDCGQHV